MPDQLRMMTFELSGEVEFALRRVVDGQLTNVPKNPNLKEAAAEQIKRDHEETLRAFLTEKKTNNR